MDNGDAGYRRFLDGDDGGIYEIIRDHKDGLILYLYGICGNITTAEELMEDTFAKIAIKKPRFKGNSSFKTWLYAIGRNVALDHMRRESKRQYVPIDELPEIADDRESLESSYLKEESRITLHRVMTRLSPDYRQVLWLVFFDGLSNSDAAAVMRRTNRQIENLLYRAKISLKSELEKEGFVYEEL